MRNMNGNDLQKTALSITKAVGSPTSIAIHTILFLGSFAAAFFGFVDFDRMLLILTTIVSLEAIYLAIFIQMTINYQGAAIAEVQEDVEEIQEDVEEISEDVDEIQKDIDEVQHDVDEIQEDIDEVQKDVEEISEDVEEISEEDAQEESAEEQRIKEQRDVLNNIQTDLQKLLADIDRLKGKN